MGLQQKLEMLQKKEQFIQVPEIPSEEEMEEYIQSIQKRDHLERMFQEHQQQMMEIQAQLDQFTEENYLFIQMDLSQAQRMIELL